MGGIVIIIKDPMISGGERRWSGHASNVANFFKLKDISAVAAPKKGDSHNGTITFDVDRKIIIVDSDYFKLSKEDVRFWRLLGFDVLARLEGEI